MLIKYVNNGVRIYRNENTLTYEYCALCVVAAYVHGELSRSQIEVNTQHFVNTKDDQNNTLGYIWL